MVDAPGTEALDTRGGTRGMEEAEEEGVRSFGLAPNALSAVQALAQNWLRTLLTMTGVVVGVMSVVTLVAILQGVKREIATQVEGLGANLVLVVPSKLDANGQPNPAAMFGISSLTAGDVQALARVPGVERISPVSIVAGAVEAVHATASAVVVGTNADGLRMNPTALAAGRDFADGEGNVCVLSYDPAHALFPAGGAVGQQVRIAGHLWRVVGVLARPEDDGTLASQLLGLSSLVYLPIETVRREIPGGQINRIVLQTDYSHPADHLLASLDATMRRSHHGQDDYGLITQRKGLALVIKLLNIAQALLVLISAISLMVAGIGIMNIMLVTVTERTREIGLRKAVGARRRDIFLQFLAEAMLLSVSGGAIGLLLAQVACTAIGRFAPLTPVITPIVVGLAIGICVVVGILFGVAPAVRAARLDPIEALRRE